MYTPRWVFGLLACLILLGLIQMRTRQVPINVAFIMPIAMMLMSAIGTLIDLGFTWATILFWLIGATGVTTLILRFSVKSIPIYDQSTGKLTLQGSWIPLVIIFAIFCTRYALKISMGMQLTVVKEFYFVPAISLILGSFSGYFIAQGICYFRAVKQTTKIAKTE